MKTSLFALTAATTRRTLQLLALLAFCCASSACQSQPQPDSGTPPDTAQLWQQLLAESQRSGCDQDSQCHSLGVGAKACGGPERYLAWSDRQRSDQRLQQLAARYAAARTADDQRQQMMSNCALVADPGAVCRAGRCELRSLDPRAPGSTPLAR